MVKISKDIPKFIIEMLGAVDYTKITDAHYDEWISIIKQNIGKHLRKKTKPSCFIILNYPIRQDLCDLINDYDFGSLSFTKLVTINPLVKKWATENLPTQRGF
jgi:hypothetical protein